MPIGGIEFVLIGPAQESIGDIILRACQRHWSENECFFQDALDEVMVHSFADAWVWRKGTASKEFFIYKNQKAVQDWRDGPTRSNANTMLHFIVGEPTDDGPTVEVAVAFDKLTSDMKRLLESLRNGFISALAAREAA